MALFVLVRHGEPRYDEVSSRGYFGMGNDLGKLTPLGEYQATNVAHDPRLKNADIIIASPYTRALETAAFISRITQIPLTVENDLHEWMPDTTHKYEFDDIFDVDAEYRASKGIRNSKTVYKWESYEALRKRFRDVLLKYKHYDKVIVVAHGYAINSQTFFDDVLLPHCGIREIRL